MEMQALIEEIALLVDKIKAGTATLGELEAFASATQQLNERAIILRYKAYEAKVYGTSLENTSLESLEEKDTLVNSVAEVKTEEPVLSTPVSVEESDDLSFDLFSMDSEEDTSTDFDIAQPEPLSSHEAIHEIEVEAEEKTNPVIEEQIVDEILPVEPIAQHIPIEEPVLEKPVIEQPIIEAIQPTVYPEKDVQPEPTPTAPVSSGHEHPVIRKARTNDGSLQSRLLSVRLETLKSAFGLNERMLIVRELFGGSNEAYTEAIEQLDSQQEVGAARTKVSDYANQYGWREDNELAIEFVQKVERRYA